MKPTDLKKDKTVTMRINSVVKERLAKMGWSTQQLLDWAIEQKIKKITIITKREKPLE